MEYPGTEGCYLIRQHYSIESYYLRPFLRYEDIKIPWFILAYLHILMSFLHTDTL